MQTSTAEQAAQKQLRKSLQAYLEGEKDLKWIVGVFHGDANSMRQVLQNLPSAYGRHDRHTELSTWLDSQPK